MGTTSDETGPDRTITVHETEEGLRYEGEEFETQLNWSEGEDWWQTTIPYWVDLLGVALEDDLLDEAQHQNLVGVETLIDARA